jgi:hypothetical protein
MSTHRHRTRPRVKPQRELTQADHDQADVADLAAELATLWRVLPHALARDSNGQFRKDKAGDRQSSGAARGSSATVNIAVMDARAHVEPGLLKFAAEAVPILNLEREHRSIEQLIDALPNWYRALAASPHGQPLAQQLYRPGRPGHSGRGELQSWLTTVRLALKVQLPDVELGPNCPEHRDGKPAPLLIEGARATIARSLLDGPPDRVLIAAGPDCVTVPCQHQSCDWIRDRRLLDHRGRPTDWTYRNDRIAWSSLDDERAFTFKQSSAVRCPHCKKRWATTAERRILQLELAVLGDKRPKELAT